MTLADFYLLCFLVGVGLSVIAFFAGGARLHGMHVHVHAAHTHVGHALRLSTVRGMRSAVRSNDLPWFNGGTLAAFLAWFGGTGYLLARYSGLWFAFSIAIAVACGLGAAAAIYRFLKFLVDREQPLDPADYDMVGAFGKLTLPIREGGTGELVYSQQGTRRVTGARSEDGSPIARGAEVLVVRYDRGIAFVRPWRDGMDADLKS